MESLKVIFAIGETGLYEDIDSFPMSVSVIKMSDRTTLNGCVMDTLFDCIDNNKFIRGQLESTLPGVYSGIFDGNKFTDTAIISRF